MTSAVGNERIPAQAEAQRQVRVQAIRVVDERGEEVHPRVLVFADALLEALELAEHEVGERVAGERRRAVERVAAVRAEVVDDVALP